MKSFILSIAVAGICLMAASCHNEKKVVLDSQSDTINWVIGQSMALGMQSSGIELDKELIVEAIRSTFEGKEQPIDEETYAMVLNYVNSVIAMNQHNNQQQQAEQADRREAAFFKKLEADNPDIKKTDDGLYYEVITPGRGRNGKLGDIAVFDYKSFTMDGVLFDQTYGNRESITHVIGNPMFQGMQDAMCMMNAGSTYRFYFPYRLAFGASGSDGIPPYATLIYEIELKELR